jgi:hypothetical protein
MGEGDVDVGVSGARVEWQEGEELGKELHRDPSIVSRLGASYAESRAQQVEDRLPRQGLKINQYERPPRPLTLGLSGSRNN